MAVKKAALSSQTTPPAKLRSRPFIATFVLIGGLGALLIAMTVSVIFGAADIDIPIIWDAIFHFNPDIIQHQIIIELRLPRILGAAIVGSGFAVAGAIMQGMTRNPLAEPGIMGLNAGAVFAMAVCFAFFPALSFNYLMLYSFLGAGAAAMLVYGIGSMAKGGLTPIRLVLAGAALNALLVALSEGLALYFRIGQDLTFWFAGGVAGIRWPQLQIILPWVIVALIAALVISRSITMLSLGDEVAKGLGQRTKLVKLAGVIIILILAGSAVSIVGNVAFVGLIVPHFTRYLVGVDYRWIIPCSAILGGLLVVISDLAARMVNPPAETPLGALIALIGVPFFLYLARKENREL